MSSDKKCGVDKSLRIKPTDSDDIRRSKSIIRYFGGIRHFSWITGTSYSCAYNYIYGLSKISKKNKIRILNYCRHNGIIFYESDFDDTSRIEKIMEYFSDAICVLCFDKNCKCKLDSKRVPWFFAIRK